MIYCGGPICLGQGYNMPRKRGSNAISQNYPGVRRGVEDVIRYFLVVATILHILGKSAKSGMQNIGRALFSM